MMQATTTHTNTARRTKPAVVRAALRSRITQSPEVTYSYAYDDQNRRIKKAVGSATTNYLYNGADIHGEYTSWSKASAIYTHGPNTDEPLIRIAANDTRYYHQDGIGSVVATTDASGNLNAAQLYDAWGNAYQTAQFGSIAQYGYTGREPDGTGLVYYRARYYDPMVGRFAQRDPIGLQGGIKLAAFAGLSMSEVHGALKRAEAARLLVFEERRPRLLTPAFKEFLFHGAKYAFPVVRGALVAGVPTAHAAAPLNAHIAPSADPVPVWPAIEGRARGMALIPLYPSAPAAALRSPALYELLALFDALRAGNARERTLAQRLFEERL